MAFCRFRFAFEKSQQDSENAPCGQMTKRLAWMDIYLGYSLLLRILKFTGARVVYQYNTSMIPV